MDENLRSQTKLTEFAPLAPEEKEQGVGHLISKIFKFGKSAISSEPATSQENAAQKDNVSQESLSSWSNVDINSDTSSKTDSTQNFQYNVNVNEGRNLPNVLQRISNLLALKSTNLQAYGDTELKQYWMPDSVSRECYECCEKFTTFRRRHHCRVCGQIFCSQCCNQKIPGKIVGCTGDLRACTYCCKVVLAYLQSPDVSAHLTADLRAFQEDLQTKFGNEMQSFPQSTTSLNSNSSDISETGSLRRKVSVGYQEEKYALGRASSVSYLTTEERIRALQNSISLRNLYEELCRPASGMILQTHRYRLRSYPNTLLGSELVDWLISQRKANTRIQASAICQALYEAGYLDCLTEQNAFCDGWALYRLQLAPCLDLPQPEQKFDTRTQDEPSWMQQIPHESSTTDSEAELPSPCTERVSHRLASSSSSYMLDLNFEDSTAHLIRPPPSEKTEIPIENESQIGSVIPAEVPIFKTSQHRELVPEQGWHNATNLRVDNGERKAYDLLTNTYKYHEINLLSQLLCVSGLSFNWRESVISLIHEIVNKIRPDKTHDAEYLDVRNYIHIKKICGGNRSESKLVEGIVCSKNVAHRGMASRLDNPKILLLNCSLVYQRTEGRLMSLEPVILQEHEYLRNVAARIVALQPNLVLVHRNVSRLAQVFLREQKITLVLNVKLSVLERLARCTDADLIKSVDAHMGRSKLGTCKHFYMKTFSSKESGMRKTLMFFDGLPLPHFGATVLLRGGSKNELTKLKQVVSTTVFASYNWRLEKSFLLDEFAQPPNPKADEFFGDGSSKESSPDFNIEMKNKFQINKEILQEELDKQPNESIDNISSKNSVNGDNETSKEKSILNKILIEEKKLPTKSVEDFSDPLHLYLTVEDDVIKMNNSQQFSVAELPFSNKFRKALDDTILSISPYLNFTVPYLETDIGRKCKLRPFFPVEIYYSKQFILKSGNAILRNGRDDNENLKNKINSTKLNPLHPFVSLRLTTKLSESNEIQSMLAHFRACGGRLPHKQFNCNQENAMELRKKSLTEDSPKTVDILDLKNHQKLAVLFCSFSHNSNNAPAFCVDPWVVNMYFYGTDDIPLGCFLERFCFRTSYTCPSETCDTAMLQHVRRFVHNSGCVSLSLNSFDSQFQEENIVMWSWCSKCSAVSPVVPMSSDTWSFSFAKYLELRFHGDVYSRRGNDACSHSLHHDHDQFFGFKNIVASFKYTTVKQWEVSLPPPLIEILYDTTNQQAEIIDEIKSLALRGHEIFSVILEKLSVLPSEDGLNILKQQLQKEHSVFKGKVEEVQLKLTSPTLEDKRLNDFSQEDVRSLLWPLEDLMVQLKKIIADTVETWNTRLLGSHKKDSDKRKDKQQQSYDTDLSETEGSVSSDIKYVEPVESESSQKTENIITSETPTSSNIMTKKIRSLDHSDHASSDVFNANSFVLANKNVAENYNSNIKLNILNPSFEELPKFNFKETTYFKNNTLSSHDEFELKRFNWLLSPCKKPIFSMLTENGYHGSTHFFTPKAIRKYKSYPPELVSRKREIMLYKVPDENILISHSPKGHFRSQSDGTVMAQSDDFFDTRKEQADKKSVKTMLSQLLQSAHGITSIQCPFSQQEHHLLPPTSTVPIVVYESEPGSIIAYALDSYDYKRSIDELTRKTTSVEQSPSPVHKRKLLSTSDRPSSTELTVPNDRHSGLLSFLWTTQKVDQPGSSPVLSAGETSENEDAAPNRDKTDDTKKSKPPYVEVEFQDAHCNFCCRVYYAERFVWLRSNVIPAGEEAYIRSLRRSVQWNARGGKSGSTFCKTKDDRFILKEMTKQELQHVLDSASNYFEYMERCISLKLPTLLGKIVGVYQIMFRNVTTNSNLRINLLVMENLFYNRTVTHKFDLKGSMRNRLVNPDDQDGEIVLLDENLLKRTCESPLYIYPHSKAVLTAAIQSDTKFLSSQKVMDYSLLVGLDQDTQELVVGIIDYIRTFTWDKKLETMVKKASMLGGQGKTPTIISPENYRDRFIAAMHRYFLQVPDRWTGLGKGLEVLEI